MILVDAHEDIAMNALCYGRDYRVAAMATRQREAGTDTPTRAGGSATVGLPDSILGRVALVFATLFSEPATAKLLALPPCDPVIYTDPKSAYAVAQRQLDYYQRLTDETDRARLVRTQSDLDTVLATWAEGTEIGQHAQGMVLLMENADPILEPKQFEEWYERGVRIVGPAWEATRYCGGTGAPGPLTPLGRELLDVMASFNAILDLSHMAEEAYFEALDRYQGVIIASHSNPRRFRNSDRHLSDDMIRRLAERDGVMGVVMFNAFLKDGWRRGDPRLPFSLVIDAIDYVCQLTGSAAHVGIGTDFDGGFGVEAIPDGLETTADLWSLGGALRARGYSEDDIGAILGGNMLRKLRQALPV
jgi:membrane dipeptidase